MSDYPNNGFRSNPDLDDGGEPSSSVSGRTDYSRPASFTDPDATQGMQTDPSSAQTGNGHADYLNNNSYDQAGRSGDSGRKPSYDRRYTGEYTPGERRYRSDYGTPPVYPYDTPGREIGKDRDRRGTKSGREKESFGKRLLKAVAVALVFGLVAGAAFAGVNRLIGGGGGRADTSTQSSSQDTGSGSSKKNAQVNVTTVDYTQVVEDVMPSVVAITGMFTQESFLGSYSNQGAGSGFITDITDKEILIGTNNHVVEGGTDLTVLFSDESSAPATLVGTDKDADLGVISVKRSDVSEETLKTIKPVTFSDEDVKVGQSVIAIGNALGYGQSVTTGVISAKNRRISFTDGSMTLLQTDAAINPGNSGGILINTSGKVIGINNAKLEDTSVEGMCYAIPVSRAVPILNDLKEVGSINPDEQGYFGIRGQSVDQSYMEMYNIPAGVVVVEVIPGSPAEKAGIQPGDVIVGFDGNEISTMEGLQKRISNQKAGKKVTVDIKRKNNGEKYEDMQVKVTMGKKSDMPESYGEGDQDTQEPETGGDQYNWEDILPYIFGN